MDEFRFKKFTVRQQRASMKVGTDGVLLGAWADYLVTDKKILDVGTGTGIIALIAAQKYSEMGADCSIYAIDIDEDAIFDASENFASSPWAGNLSARKISLQEMPSGSDSAYDLIISNPPFFENSFKAPDAQRSMARHTDTLSYSDLLSNACRLLKDEGRIALVLPFGSLSELRSIAVSNCLKIKHITTVRTTPEKAPKRVLVELVRTTVPLETRNDELVIQSAGIYSSEYIYLTKGLYLKF